MFKIEAKKIIKNKFFLIAFLLCILSQLTGLIFYYSNVVYWSNLLGSENRISSYYAWFFCLSLGSSIYRILLPLLFAPLIDSYFIENKNGYSNYVISRIGYKKYFTSKYFSGLIFALIMVFFTLIMSLLVCFILFPENIPSSDFIDIDGKLETIFIKSPLILIFLLILSNLFFTIIYYTVGFSSICFIKNRYLLMLLPFIVYIFFTIISQIIGIPALSPLAYIAPYELSNFSIFSYFICTTLLIVTITYMFINCYKKMKENIV